MAPLPRSLPAFGVLRIWILEARQRVSGLSSAQSRAVRPRKRCFGCSHSVSLHTFCNSYLAWQLCWVARQACQAGLRGTQNWIPGADSSAAPISHDGVAVPPARPQSRPVPQLRYSPGSRLRVPSSLPHLHAGRLPGGHQPLPQVRAEKSPLRAAEDVGLFFLGVRKLEYGGDFPPQPDLQTLGKVNSFAL